MNVYLPALRIRVCCGLKVLLLLVIMVTPTQQASCSVRCVWYGVSRGRSGYGYGGNCTA